MTTLGRFDLQIDRIKRELRQPRQTFTSRPNPRNVLVAPLEDPDAPWHGTLTGYTAHKCRCAMCKRCLADYAATRRAEPPVRDAEPKMGRPRNPNVPHGITGYMNYRCRCVVCKASNAEHSQRRRDNRKAQRICVICGKPAFLTNTLCLTCRGSEAARMQARRYTDRTRQPALQSAEGR